MLIFGSCRTEIVPAGEDLITVTCICRGETVKEPYELSTALVAELCEAAGTTRGEPSRRYVMSVLFVIVVVLHV